MKTAAVLVLAVVIAAAITACGYAVVREPEYPVLLPDVGEDEHVVDLAWVDAHKFYYLIASDWASDAPAKLWISTDGEQHQLHSFNESRLRWDRPCENPYFFGIAAKSVDTLVSLVLCYESGDTRIVAVADDGAITSLGPAPDAHDLAWRRGTEEGAVVIGSSTCRSVAPVVGGTVSRWSSSGPPWNLNDMAPDSTCALRGRLTNLGTSPGRPFAFVSTDRDASPLSGTESTLHEIAADGANVLDLTGGLEQVNGLAVVGDDIVVSATRGGKTGLWRWVRATGEVGLLAKGSFTRIAVNPDGSAIAAVRTHGDTEGVVRIDLQ